MTENASPDHWTEPLRRFDRYLMSAGIARSTRQLRHHQLRRAARWLKCPPEEVTYERLERYVGHSAWKPSTRRNARAALRVFFAWALVRGLVESDPAAALPSVRVPTGTPRPAPDHSLRSGLRWADSRVELMIRLAAHAGLRCCEIAAVRPRDVETDMVGSSLRVVGKGSRVRLVPLPDDLAAVVRNHDGEWLFPGQIDGHLSAAYVSKLVSQSLPEGVTAHMLRHRYATRAYAAERDLLAVQRLLGHASVATTQVYTRVPDGALRSAALAAAA